jgi:hypothetical protein
MRKSYGWKLLLCIDLTFAVLFFDCEEGETASSYIGRNMMGSWQQRSLDWVFYKLTGIPDHCQRSIQPQFTQGN